MKNPPRTATIAVMFALLASAAVAADDDPIQMIGKIRADIGQFSAENAAAARRKEYASLFENLGTRSKTGVFTNLNADSSGNPDGPFLLLLQHGSQLLERSGVKGFYLFTKAGAAFTPFSADSKAKADEFFFKIAGLPDPYVKILHQPGDTVPFVFFNKSAPEKNVEYAAANAAYSLDDAQAVDFLREAVDNPNDFHDYVPPGMPNIPRSF